MFIAGIDYSITSPAVCVYHGAKEHPSVEDCQFYYLTKTKRLVGKWDNFEGTLYPDWKHPMERYTAISLWVIDCLRRNRSGTEEPFVVIENYGFSASGRITDLAEHTGVLKKRLWDMNISYTTESVSKVKKYLTGKGNASKMDIYNLWSGLIPSVFPKGKSPISDCLDAYGVVLAATA